MKKWFFILVVFQVNYVLGQSWDISRPVNPLDGIYRLAFQKADSSDACMFPQVFGIDRQYLMGQNDSIGMNGFTIIPSVSLASGLSRFNNQFQGFHQTVGQLNFYSKYKNKLAVQLSYYHLLSDLPQTIATSVASDNTILGWGKALGDFAGLYRAQTWTGKLTYHPNRHVSLEVGRGKMFFGDGYRSLVISHNAAAMPYGRMVADLGPFRFNAQWAQLKDNSLGWDQLRTKYIGMHSLTYEATKKLTFTLYEMVIWQKSDRTSARNFDMHYLNPIAFWQPIEYAQGSADNSLLGLNMSYVYKQKCKFYFQFLLDEWLLSEVKAKNGWWGLKYGGQLGVKAFDVIPGWDVLSEVNAVRPFTYSHASSLQAWGQLGQPLAHPWGANFIEWVNMAQFKKKDWTVILACNYGAYGLNRSGLNDGGNIFLSYKDPAQIYGNDFFQGDKRIFLFQRLQVSKKILKNSLECFGEVMSRTHYLPQMQSQQFLMIGIRTPGYFQDQWDY